jgi:hypothetical protein
MRDTGKRYALICGAITVLCYNVLFVKKLGKADFLRPFGKFVGRARSA